MLRREFLKAAGMVALMAGLPGSSSAGLFDRFLAAPATSPRLRLLRTTNSTSRRTGVPLRFGWTRGN